MMVWIVVSFGRTQLVQKGWCGIQERSWVPTGQSGCSEFGRAALLIDCVGWGVCEKGELAVGLG